MKPSVTRVAHAYLRKLAAQVSPEFQKEIEQAVASGQLRNKSVAVGGYVYKDGGVLAQVGISGEIFLKLDDAPPEVIKALPPKAVAQAVMSGDLDISELDDDVVMSLPLKVLYRKRKLVSREVLVGALQGKKRKLKHGAEWVNDADFPMPFVQNGFDRKPLVRTSDIEYDGDWQDGWGSTAVVKGDTLFVVGSMTGHYGRGKVHDSAASSILYFDWPGKWTEEALEARFPGNDHDSGEGTVNVQTNGREFIGEEVVSATRSEPFKAEIPLLKAPQSYFDFVFGKFAGV
jgi:hypothetical protein